MRHSGRPGAWIRTAALGAAGLVGFLVACDAGPTVEQDGDGALAVFHGDSVGVDIGIVDIGETRSAGSIPLCRTDPERPVMLRRIEAISVVGEVRVESIAVRTVTWAPPDGSGDPSATMIGTFRGTPPGVRAATGYIVPTSCDAPDAPVGEVVVTLRKIGREGGRLRGLRLTYVADRETHRMLIRFSFGLCGTSPPAPRCRAR